MITITTYRAVLQHDKGRSKLIVTSLSGRQGAIDQIIAAEHCPETAIKLLKEIKKKTIQ